MTLIGDLAVQEGSSAKYALYLDGDLAQNTKVTFTLKVGGTATAGDDFLQLLGASLVPAPGVTITFTTNPGDGSTVVTAEYSTGTAIPEPLPGPGNPGYPTLGAQLLSFEISTIEDNIKETGENISIELLNSSNTSILGNSTSSPTTIVDVTPQINLIGETTVAEGGTAAYAVVLEGTAALRAGQSITLTLDSVSGTATEGLDFAALLAANLQPAAGVAFSAIRTDPLSKAVTLTVTNTSGGSLVAGSQLLSFSIVTNADAIAETNETFAVTLSSPPAGATVSNGSITTTIRNTSGGLINYNLTPADWLELNGDAPGSPPFTGIAGSENDPILVSTGDTANRIWLSDAIAFATLDTGGGNDLVQVLFPAPRDSVTPFVQFGHGAYKATIRTGDGNDVINIQSFENSAYVRSSPQDPPFYNRPDYYDSIVDAGNGNDYVYGFLPYKTQFLGGDGVDTLFLYGRFSDWSVQSVDPAGDGLDLGDASSDYTIWNASPNLSNTAIENTVHGFEFIQFNDIKLDLVEKLTLTPSAAAFVEGSTATYTIALAGNGLQQGESVAFSLQLSNGSAQFATDLAALVQSSLQGAAGIALQDLSVDAATGLLRVVASATREFRAGATIATLSLPIQADLLAETDETFGLTLDGFIEPLTVITTIRDVLPITIRLNGSATVTEGSTADYAVVLDGGGLDPGRSITFSLDSISGTATEGSDFAPLLATSLQKANGIQLSAISTAADGTVTVTATNSSGAPLAVGATLLTAQLPITTDSTVEGNETFSVTLASSTAVVSSGVVTTTINDLVPIPTIALSGEASVAEGQSAAYAVSLAGSGLLAGQSITLTLESVSGTAIEGVDFTALVAAGITAGAGISLSAISIDPASKAITLTATNTSGGSLADGSQLLSFFVVTNADAIAETNETFAVTLSSPPAGATVSNGSITTTITDNDAAVIKLTAAAPPLITEGRSANYSVSLDGVALGVGGSVTFTLDSSSGTATEGIDFAALTPAALTAGAGITLSAISTNPTTKAVTVTATNSSSADLGSGSQLVSFAITSFVDSIVENSELFGLSLTSTTATVSEGAFLWSVIKDSPPSSFQEPGALTTINSIGNVALGSNLFGYALKVGNGSPIQITSNGVNASPTSPGAGWNAIAAAANGAGFDLYFKNTNGSYALWNLNGAGAFRSGRVLSMAEVLTAESRLGADLDGDRSIGFTFTPSRTIGGVALGTTQLGYGLQVGASPGAKLAAGSPIQITYNGVNASPASPGAGWTAIAAMADGAGFDLYFKNTNGSYAIWNLNAAGAFTSGKMLSLAEVLTAESQINTDLNGDQQIGFSFNPSRTIGDVALGSTQLGYGLKVGAGSPIQITYNGVNASPASPGAGWTAIAAAANGAVFDLYFKNTNGSYAIWNLNGAGAFTSGQMLSLAELHQAEVANREDLSGEGQIGPFAFQRGGPQADLLTGLANGASFGFAGDDTLTGGSPSANGFDILMGGSGNDSYVLPSGRSTLVIDNGGDASDSVTALGLSLNGATTTISTLEKGRHLVLSDSASNSRLYLYDWQSASNRVETFQLQDGLFSFQQLQQKVISLGASVTDATWANWDSQFGNGQLTRTGFASGAAMDNLISFYKGVDSSGVLA